MKKKLIIFCIAAGLSFTLAATSFAAPTLDLNADSLTPGLYYAPELTISTVHGPVTFEGEIYTLPGGLASDQEFVAAGASGNVFDVGKYQGGWAELSWENFQVGSATFIYGGNAGNITVEARDKDGNVLDSYYQADTYWDQPAGPVTLWAGEFNSIQSLYWKDTSSTNDFAALDNISLTIIPAPGAILLGSIGVGLVGWLRRKKTL